MAGLEGVLFEAKSSKGMDYYHTNIVLCIGDHFAVICKESIQPQYRDIVMRKLSEDREVVEISYEQTEKHFCGNMLQVNSKDGSKK